MPRRDLSLDQQKCVLDCLYLLRGRFETWETVERALPISHSMRCEITSGRAEVSTAIAFRIAKFMGVSLYDVLNGTAAPPGMCPHCGKMIAAPQR